MFATPESASSTRSQAPRMTVGHDLVYLPTFREQLADPASTFRTGTFTAAELRASEQRARTRMTEETASRPLDLAPHLGARYAAKEAFLKAWDLRHWGAPPPLSRTAVDLREVEVRTDAWGRPQLVLHGHLAETLASSEPPLALSLTLSHDGPFASAVVLMHEVTP